MWSFNRKTKAALLGCVVMAAGGCYKSHLCGSEETCNFVDDDCDFRVDEGFRDEAGRYASEEHCGGCGVRCADVFPTAAATECVVDGADGGVPFCRIVSCPPGWHIAGDGGCAENVPVLCLPCTEDSDCTQRDPGSACVPLIEDGVEQGRCVTACGDGTSCPPGFGCVRDSEGLLHCVPVTGECGCTEETLGTEFACIVERDEAHSCAGSRLCTEEGLAECTPALSEQCNGEDEDCDGAVDEDFRDASGLYVARLHCGGCAMPCVEPGPNMVASCNPDPAGPNGVTCEIECVEGFVDVDGIGANGCECERFDGEGPPPVIGGDSDCDGVPDNNDDFIYVTTAGSDTNPGTLARPMRTVQAALSRGATTGRDVLVARGIYNGHVDLVPGVSLYGGYRPDFRDRDVALFPVLLENRNARPGSPVLTCHGIRVPTRVEGLTVQGTDAVQAGRGSTTGYFDGCGPEVELASIVVIAGRGADGARGNDSSDNLAEVGLMSLDELEGEDGGNGLSASGTCDGLAAGGGGQKLCPGENVSGGRGGDADCPDLGCVNGSPCGNGGCTDFTTGGVCDFEAVLSLAVPNPAARRGRGAGAGEAGNLTYNAPTNRDICNFCDDNPTLLRNGDDGGDGAHGEDGAGGVGCQMPPDFEVATGLLHGVPGTGGTAGQNGSGGGGATSGAGYAVIGGTTGGCLDHSGGSGGGGGSGGCGAPRADGGGGGGASVGLAIRLEAGATQGPAFDDTRVVTASGGAGGDGGIGAAGGSGGSGGLGGGASFWCARNGGRGGDGGRGGAAGGGGGGCGGGSHGVFLWPRGAASVRYVDDIRAHVNVEAAGVAGRGGAGGFSPGEPGTMGLPGSDAPIGD